MESMKLNVAINDVSGGIITGIDQTMTQSSSCLMISTLILTQYVFTFTLSFTVDNMLINQLFIHSRLLRALSDNICHGLLSVGGWLSFLILNWSSLSHEKNFLFNQRNRSIISECILSYFMGSIIDVDHFLAAGSISFSKAINLSTRPFGHCFITLFFLSAAIITLTYPSWKKLTFQFIIAYIVHMLRDATRRGLWLWPGMTTMIIPYTIHLILISTFPILMTILWKILEIRRFDSSYGNSMLHPKESFKRDDAFEV